jgi:hypothetical protein
MVDTRFSFHHGNDSIFLIRPGRKIIKSYYDPYLARFISPDSIIPQQGSPLA